MYHPNRTTPVSIFLVLTGLLFSALTGAGEDAESGNSQTAAHMLELWKPGESGQRMRIRGRITSVDGSPIPNVNIRVRHADSEGFDWSYYQGTMVTNNRGIYQFGSVIPGNSHRLSHVHVYISHPEYLYVETEFYFKNDPKVNPDDPNAIFLEEASVNGEVMMYGRWDITLEPR